MTERNINLNKDGDRMTGKLKQLAGRIRELREIAGLTVGEMAARTDTPVDEYIACENGEHDLSFA
ncbi:MAG: helix-turn-helix domain-containing protein, partial [Lachnospiraceae bacterium]|nr:helix-turn-helix domain-containing protein [Lachnospiraceae bacterium]